MAARPTAAAPPEATAAVMVRDLLSWGGVPPLLSFGTELGLALGLGPEPELESPSFPGIVGSVSLIPCVVSFGLLVDDLLGLDLDQEIAQKALALISVRFYPYYTTTVERERESGR